MIDDYNQLKIEFIKFNLYLFKVCFQFLINSHLINMMECFMEFQFKLSLIIILYLVNIFQSFQIY